jgi:hypothetical protein
MEEMVRYGRVRIGPASYYQNAELDAARRDDELKKSLLMPGGYTKINTQDGKQILIIEDIIWSVRAQNYYALCMSCDWDPALLTAFGADTCVAIRMPEVFAQRLKAAANPQLRGWYFHHDPISYFDPYEVRMKQHLDACMCKDFRFAYQREYRFLWTHLEGADARGFKYLDLGRLDDIAEIHA